MSTLQSAQKIASEHKKADDVLEDIKESLANIVDLILNLDVIGEHRLDHLASLVDSKALSTKLRAVDITPKNSILSHRLFIGKMENKPKWVSSILDVKNESSTAFYHFITSLIQPVSDGLLGLNTGGVMSITSAKILKLYVAKHSSYIIDILSDMHESKSFHHLFVGTSSGVYRIRFGVGSTGPGYVYEWLKVLNLDKAYDEVPLNSNQFSLPGRNVGPTPHSVAMMQHVNNGF